MMVLEWWSNADRQDEEGSGTILSELAKNEVKPPSLQLAIIWGAGTNFLLDENNILFFLKNNAAKSHIRRETVTGLDLVEQQNKAAEKRLPHLARRPGHAAGTGTCLRPNTFLPTAEIGRMFIYHQSGRSGNRRCTTGYSTCLTMLAKRFTAKRPIKVYRHQSNTHLAE
jgi:acetyl/propionyl-CoA carboxylase alpha subunit